MLTTRRYGGHSRKSWSRSGRNSREPFVEIGSIRIQV
jgi:hypothetical protein